MSGRNGTVLIVEGASDKVALETLAARTALDLEAIGTSIVPIGGAHAIRRFLNRLAADDPGVHVAGMCDVAQEGYFKRALEGAGLGDDLSRERMERLGFYVCVEDLEDELIRALGPPGVEGVIEEQGEIRSFRSFQKQPAQSRAPIGAQLRRFLGTHSGRKSQYARALVEALDIERVPQPLQLVLGATGTPLGQ